MTHHKVNIPTYGRTCHLMHPNLLTSFALLAGGIAHGSALTDTSLRLINAVNPPSECSSQMTGASSASSSIDCIFDPAGAIPPIHYSGAAEADAGTGPIGLGVSVSAYAVAGDYGPWVKGVAHAASSADIAIEGGTGNGFLQLEFAGGGWFGLPMGTFDATLDGVPFFPYTMFPVTFGQTYTVGLDARTMIESAGPAGVFNLYVTSASFRNADGSLQSDATWTGDGFAPVPGPSGFGPRSATVPEPSSFLLIAAAMLFQLCIRIFAKER